MLMLNSNGRWLGIFVYPDERWFSGFRTNYLTTTRDKEKIFLFSSRKQANDLISILLELHPDLSFIVLEID